MKIGFFGDSYCAVEKQDPDEYETYIHKLKKHYNAEIVNLGKLGSSIYDSILLQFKDFYVNKNVPDICIFTWTHYARLFDRNYRHITAQTIPNGESVYEDYYKYVYDEEQVMLQYISVLKYFDTEILGAHPNVKFIHLYCFNNELKIFDKQAEYIFNNGVTIQPPLYDLSIQIPDQYVVRLKNIKKPNHIVGDRKNSFLYENIVNAIDNYENKKVLTTNYTDYK